MKHIKKINESEGGERVIGQKVDVYVMVSGDYCAFHELSLTVVYDITNDINLGDNTEEELSSWDYHDDGGGYSDVTSTTAIKIGDKYYLDSNL